MQVTVVVRRWDQWGRREGPVPDDGRQLVVAFKSGQMLQSILVCNSFAIILTKGWQMFDEFSGGLLIVQVYRDEFCGDHPGSGFLFGIVDHTKQ